MYQSRAIFFFSFSSGAGNQLPKETVSGIFSQSPRSYWVCVSIFIGTSAFMPCQEIIHVRFIDEFISINQSNLATRHLEIIHVILSAAKDLARWTHRSFAALRACPRAKRRDDMQDTARGRSREIFSPNVYLATHFLDIHLYVCLRQSHDPRC